MGRAMTILIGYATEHGSTRGVAERIGTRLTDAGLDVDVLPLSAVIDLNAYDAVILGSAIHDGTWLPDAAEYVTRHRTALVRGPLWLFSVGLLGERTSVFPGWVARSLRQLRSRHESDALVWLRTSVAPIGHRYFTGVIEREHWPVIGRVMFALMGGRYGDHRDWFGIDAWADEVVRYLDKA